MLWGVKVLADFAKGPVTSIEGARKWKPSVDTSKPASRGHFKTGQLRWRCKTSVPLPLLVLHVQVDS
jgi:hypothetical protein